MGTQNKRFGAIRNLSTIETKRMLLQTQIDDSKDIEERKRFGQFATPFKLAKEIISYGLTLQDNKEISFLEPALGTGSFYSALLSEINKFDKYIKSAIGIELDDKYYSVARELWKDSDINLIHADFTVAERTGTANFLISNPPYVRHHYISQEKKVGSLR